MISCICPTFGRANLLEEAIESFLRQDYLGEKELLILNDADWQTLELDLYENIKLRNCKKRFFDMGSKWNWLIDKAKYNILIPWPSDDIMLPHAIAQFVYLLGNNGYVHPLGRHVMTAKEYRGYSHHGCQGIIAFTKETHEEAGGYPSIYGGQDTEFLKKLRKICKRNEPKLDEKETFFIYRWAGIPLHLSGTKTDEGWEKLYKQMKAKYPETHIKLNPHWDMDYTEIVRSNIQ